MATSVDALSLATLLVKLSEGCKLVAYPDPATGAAPWTIGYGATGAKITPNTVWTQAQADLDLAERLCKLLLQIRQLVPAATNPQLAACTSFAYNCGMAALKGSTWFRKLKQSRPKVASVEILKWNKANGKIMAGLTTRRQREAKLLLGDYQWLLISKK